MTIDPSTISFATWSRNHEDQHSAKWCRELYPWQVIRLLNFEPHYVGVNQVIEFYGETYVARVMESWVADHGRTNIRVSLQSEFASNSSKWEHRGWNDTFQLIFGEDGYFVTIFTKKDDPSKQLLADFMRGRFDRIETKRCKPLSALFFKSLISYAADSMHSGLSQYRYFENCNFAPFLSLERNLWICFAFTEEKAHQVAMQNAMHCDRLISIYCHPTFSKHHRCSTSKVLSLPEFMELAFVDTRRRFLPQVRFLVNHLHRNSIEHKSTTSENLRSAILSHCNEIQPIPTSLLREAKSGLGACIETAADAAYFFACANLLNAAMNEQLGAYNGAQQLRKEVYSFKSVVGKAFDRLIQRPVNGVVCYFDDEGAMFVEIHGIQISFHAIPKSQTLRSFIVSNQNQPRAWSGIRLQRKAALVLEWASALLHEELLGTTESNCGEKGK